MSTVDSDQSFLSPCPACDTLNRIPRRRWGEEGQCGRCRAPLRVAEPLVLDEARFARQIKGDVPIVVDFWASWCGPCVAMAPVFEATARVLASRYRFAKIDVDRETRLAERLGIRAVPTLAVCAGGREVARRSGGLSGEGLRAWLAEMAQAG
jgi:thioredoxin 2